MPDNLIEQDDGLKRFTNGEVPLFMKLAVAEEYDRISPSPHLEIIEISALDKKSESASVITSEPREEKDTPVPKLASNINEVFTTPLRAGAKSQRTIDNVLELDAVKFLRPSPSGAIS